MASQFDFLRVKWPKLAAMAADATRLADVSPSSSLLSLRTFCEWAGDIALDFYELQVAGGASQIEKLEALQASGMVPSEMLQKFHNVRSAGTRTSLKEADSSSKLVHGCISDCLDIGQWLFREAEKEGWPHIDGYAQSYGAIPMTGLSMAEGSGYDVGNEYGSKFSMKRFMRKYGSLVSLIVVVVVLAGIGIGISLILKGLNAEKDPPLQSFEATLTPSLPPSSIIAFTPSPEPTPEEDPFDYIDDIAISLPFDTLFKSNWNFKDKNDPFVMNTTTYTKGLGMFVPSNEITGERGSKTAAWNLAGKYYKISFDMGCEQSMGYDIQAKFGKYEIIISADGSTLWESGYHDYEYVLENMEIPLPDNCSRLEIKLVQYKGTNGTLNIVLGNFKLYKVLEDGG